jgi:hypothetical protein
MVRGAHPTVLIPQNPNRRILMKWPPIERMKIALFSVLLWLLTACSTHQIKTESSNHIKDFGQDIKVVVTGGSSDISNQLSRHIQANLLTAGFNIVNDEQATHLDVAISAFSPGNAALRLTIGFGAGRGSLV